METSIPRIVESWKMCNLCTCRAYRDGLCPTHWAARYSCVPAWKEEEGEWCCKNCGRLVIAEELGEPCHNKTKQ